MEALKKQERQNIIRQLLIDHEIKKQADFVDLLKKKGVDVTQATVSRDMSDMQLLKVPAQNGGYRYSMPPQKTVNASRKLQQTISDSFVTMRAQDNLIFIKVIPGSGPVVANLLEQMAFSEIFGTLGDDSSVLVICTNKDQRNQLEVKINQMIQYN